VMTMAVQVMLFDRRLLWFYGIGLMLFQAGKLGPARSREENLGADKWRLIPGPAGPTNSNPAYSVRGRRQPHPDRFQPAGDSSFTSRALRSGSAILVVHA